jgi:hypothetical protein
MEGELQEAELVALREQHGAPYVLGFVRVDLLFVALSVLCTYHCLCHWVVPS